jgi:signal transduction histidine kinase
MSEDAKLSPERDPAKVRSDLKLLKDEVHRLASLVVEADRAKTEYMQNVAHQLAAPINAIKMNIEALQNERIPIDRKKVLLRSIYAQGTILAHLIKNYSLMSHLDADHALDTFREEPEQVDLFLLCVNFSNDFQPAGRHKEQTILVN